MMILNMKIKTIINYPNNYYQRNPNIFMTRGKPNYINTKRGRGDRRY